jgi:hypothetical protein
MKVIPTLACWRQKQWAFFSSSLIYNYFECHTHPCLGLYQRRRREQIFYGEFNGSRRKRVPVKIIGE